MIWKKGQGLSAAHAYLSYRAFFLHKIGTECFSIPKSLFVKKKMASELKLLSKSTTGLNTENEAVEK